MLAWVCKPEQYTLASASAQKHISLLPWPNFMRKKKQLDLSNDAWKKNQIVLLIWP